MSVVSSIRDYVEFLNTLSDSLGNQFTSSKFITETFLYFLKTLQYSVYYIFSFQWLRDFTLLPVTIPQISHAIFSENLFLEVQEPSKVFFQFLEIPSLQQNKFLLGLFNSFFLTLPITVTHIITIRRLIIQGIPAAGFSLLGFLTGQTLFILCVTFGLRSILIPWLSLEPFNYILGFILIFQLVYNMVEENLTYLKWNDPLNKKIFRNFFLLNLLLSWCEQSCIFQYFSNITLSEYPSIVEGFSTKTTLASFFGHSSYIFGIFLGSLIFSILWAFFVLQIKNLIVSFTNISLSSFVQTINKATFIVVLGFTLSSIPFYSFDYLFTGPLGFISGDDVFKNTLFAQNKIKDPYSVIFNPQEPYLNFDVAPFDRGRYVLSPEFYTFEDLNYRGEFDWTTRTEKQSNIGDSKAGFLSITKIFKKQKDNNVVNKNQIDSQEFNKYNEYNSILPENYPETKGLSFNTLEKSSSENRFYSSYGFKELDVSNEEDAFYLQLEKDNAIKNNFKEHSSFSYPAYPENFSQLIENRPEHHIEKKIKQKYYSNPIYKNLLALDIDLFLNRQLDSTFLEKQYEIDLYQKRQILNSYYNSLRFYKDLPESFEEFFDGTKSFTNKIYNQQFKGTLEIVRRLFSLQIKSGKENSPEEFTSDLKVLEQNTLNSPLKYDQPLYENKIKFVPYHEEIPDIEFFDKKKPQFNEIKKLVLQQMIIKPLYAGWDENLRKFVLTNKLQPQVNAGYEINVSQDWFNQFQREKQIYQKQNSSNINLTGSQKINFSMWPKSIETFYKSQVPYSSLFYTKIDTIIDNVDKSVNPKDGLLDSLKTQYKSLPSNAKYVEQHFRSSEKSGSKSESTFDDLMPKRGGFIWPGNLSFDFKKIFK